MKKIIFIIILILVVSGIIFTFRSKDVNYQVTGDLETENLAEENKYDQSVLYGKWKSVEDKLFVRVFEEGNTFKDLYGESSEAVSNGTWFVFDIKSAPSNLDYAFVMGKNYISINDLNSTLVFEITEVNSSSLVLTYLDSGVILRFNKI